MKEREERPDNKGLDRRSFVKWSALAGGGLATGMSLNSCRLGVPQPDAVSGPTVVADRIIRVGCPAHNCGGKCLLKVHVKDGRIFRIEGDDRPDDDIGAPQLRPCIRGRGYLKRQYHPDRLKYPLKRTGKRGEGKFARISWDEALDTMHAQISRVIKEYGNSALYIPYGTGSYSNTNGRGPAARLINMLGGCLGFYNSYSWACTNIATPYIYGTLASGNQRQDWLNSKYILMWGWNPAEMRDGTNSDFILRKAREKGARVVCIDPRMSLSAVSLADEWIPICPGTDTAMMSAMAWVILKNNLQDTDFIRRSSIGFDKETMPEGYENEESYTDYILGTKDGQAKTPEWAAPICRVPAKTIERIALEYASAKPAVLYQGYGMQRRAYGEQVVRAGATLATITGNIGIPGGWASGLANQAGNRPFWSVFPTGRNPVRASIPCFLWTEAVLRGKEMGPEQGVRNAEKLDNDIKLIWAVASNALINQHGNVNRSAGILKDESKVEFIAVQDNFITPTGRFADLILPACTQFETWGIEDGWKYGDEMILMPKVVDPPYETKSDYRICADLAARFGIEDQYTEGRDEEGWVNWAVEERYRKRWMPDVPSLRRMKRKNQGVYVQKVEKPRIAFEDFRKNPEKNPLPTPSGKIEIFSPRLAEMQKPELIPAIPKYIQEWESPFGEEAKQYPLMAMGHHYASRVHSTHDNNSHTMEAFPQRAFINPKDAKDRGIKEGNEVKIWNDRGTMVIPCRITRTVMPGLVDIPQGAWWEPDEKGIDRRGCINVLTSEKWTPLAFGNAQHTIMVQMEKA